MDLEVIILRKLFRHRYIGGKHTAIENLTKSIPRHLKGDAKRSIKKLIKKNLLLIKPTSYGLHVSLNPEKIVEIKNILNP